MSPYGSPAETRTLERGSGARYNRAGLGISLREVQIRSCLRYSGFCGELVGAVLWQLPSKTTKSGETLLDVPLCSQEPRASGSGGVVQRVRMSVSAPQCTVARPDRVPFECAVKLSMSYGDSHR